MSGSEGGGTPTDPWPTRAMRVPKMVDPTLPHKRCDFYVYVIFRLTGEPCYVGKGCRERWLRHGRRSHNEHLNRIYAKSGGDLPIIKVRSGLTHFEAMETEIALIAAIGRFANGGPLVNQTDGGEGVPGFSPTEETRKKMAENARGRVYSAETREKMGIAKRGKSLTAEHIAKATQCHIGRKNTPETIAKMIIAQAALRALRGAEIAEKIAASKRGKPRDPTTIAKMSAARIGKKLTPESIAKRSATQTGRPRSAATRAKMSAARMGRQLTSEHRAALSAGWARRRELGLKNKKGRHA